jgi:hypothetical protein
MMTPSAYPATATVLLRDGQSDKVGATRAWNDEMEGRLCQTNDQARRMCIPNAEYQAAVLIGWQYQASAAPPLQKLNDLCSIVAPSRC